MHIIPATILDNFFEDPDSIRKWALSLEYKPDPEGKWPGVRSESLEKVNRNFVDYMSQKYFNLFFDFNHDRVHWSIDAMFQIVDNSYGKGWIHEDSFRRMTGIIYLTPNPNPNSGTSIYKRKDEINLPDSVNFNKIKGGFFTGNVPQEEAVNARDQLETYYQETISVNNVYNRLVTFDSHLHHAAQEFVSESNEPRLTLVFFITELLADKTPIYRVRSIT